MGIQNELLVVGLLVSCLPAIFLVYTEVSADR